MPVAAVSEVSTAAPAAEISEVPVHQTSSQPDLGASRNYREHLEKENEELKAYLAKTKESLATSVVRHLVLFFGFFFHFRTRIPNVQKKITQTDSDHFF